MIEYVVAENPDQRVIDRAVKCLTSNGVIAFATPTGWCFGVDPRSKKGVDQLYGLKRASKKKHFSLLCRDLTQISQYSVIPDRYFTRLRKVLPGPYTFILNPTPNIPSPIKQYWKQKEVGVRAVPGQLIAGILNGLESPLLVGSITHELFQKNHVEQDSFILSYLVEDEFEHCLDMIIDDSTELIGLPSTVIDLTDDVPELIREGAGEISLFGS